MSRLNKCFLSENWGNRAHIKPFSGLTSSQQRGDNRHMVCTGRCKMITNRQLWYTYQQHYLIITILYAAKYLIIPAASAFSKNSNPRFPGYNNSTIQYKTIRCHCPINGSSLCSPADRTFYKMSTLTQVQGGVPQAVSLIGIGAVAQQQLHLSSKKSKKDIFGI